MVNLRRTDHEPRIEIMPMIDVIFLLLTFFIYAMVLVIRPELVPMELKQFAAGERAEPTPAVTISIDSTGGLFLDRQAIDLDALISRLREIRRADESTVIYIAADMQGETDRLPVFLDLYDRLAVEGIDVRLVGRPGDGG